ncbi:MAG: flagellar basal body rod protein FlgB [Armatimonadetes bacterium]|nr:flagellar basal body rod protein FlgB [Armatimonadota bacterium]
MSVDNFFGDYPKILEKALDAAALRQQVISNNIANANTPGYVGTNVAFENQLRDAMLNSTFRGAVADANDSDAVAQVSFSDIDDPDHFLSGGEQNLDTVHGSFQKNAHQGLDVNQEMANLAKTQIMYNAMAGKLSGMFSGLRFVIENTSR